MKHLHTFESFLIEEKNSLDIAKDFPVDSFVYFNDGEVWKVIKTGGKQQGSKKPNEILIRPENLLAKQKNTSLDIAVDIDYLNKNVDAAQQLGQNGVNEATSDTILYRVEFKPEYSQESGLSNSPIDPVFVQMNTGERTKIAQYAAIDKIGGYGKTTFDALMAKDRINTSEITYAALFNMIKTLHRIKFKR